MNSRLIKFQLLIMNNIYAAFTAPTVTVAGSISLISQ